MNPEQFDWQTVVALGVVCCAIAVLLTKTWKSLRGTTSACGSGCTGCPANSDAHDPLKIVELVPLGRSSTDHQGSSAVDR